MQIIKSRGVVRSFFACTFIYPIGSCLQRLTGRRPYFLLFCSIAVQKIHHEAKDAASNRQSMKYPDPLLNLPFRSWNKKGVRRATDNEWKYKRMLWGSLCALRPFTCWACPHLLARILRRDARMMVKEQEVRDFFRRADCTLLRRFGFHVTRAKLSGVKNRFWVIRTSFESEKLLPAVRLQFKKDGMTYSKLRNYTLQELCGKSRCYFNYNFRKPFFNLRQAIRKRLTKAVSA